MIHITEYKSRQDDYFSIIFISKGMEEKDEIDKAIYNIKVLCLGLYYALL
jgi:hypothetical protein